MLAALLPSLRHVECSYLIRALAGAAAAIPIRFPLAGCAVVAFLSLFCKDRALERDRPYQRKKGFSSPLSCCLFPLPVGFYPPFLLGTFVGSKQSATQPAHVHAFASADWTG